MGQSCGLTRCSFPGCARKIEKLSLFFKDPEAALGIESATREARFGPELDWEKPWRGQVFRARIGARNERKVLVLIGVQRERLASKV